MTENPSAPVSEETGSENISGDASERAHASKLKTPGGFQRVKSSVFGRDTRSGRFFRRLLRGLLVVIVCFGAGALTIYLLLYRPAVQQLQASQTQSGETNAQLTQAQQDLETAQQELSKAQKQAKAAQDALTAQQNQVLVLNASKAVLTARLAVVNDDQDTASSALDEAQAAVEKIQNQDATQVSTLQALFTLTRVDLGRDLNLAGQDLDRLLGELDRMESALQ